MKRSFHHAFTLIELLVVIVVIGVLAGIVLPVYSNVQLSAKRVQSLNNMRQLGAAALSYCGDNNGALPAQVTKTPVWGTTTADWYNALPRTYMGSQNLNDYAANPPAFYTKGSVFYVPAAKYPPKATSNATPQFAVAFNSKLFTSTVTSVRLAGIMLPASTVLFQECGCVGETVIKGQSAYSDQAYSYASRTVARYNGNTILTFCDGHASSFTGSSVVDPSSGKAYYAAYPNPLPTGAATVYWEVNPATSPN